MVNRRLLRIQREHYDALAGQGDLELLSTGLVARSGQRLDIHRFRLPKVVVAVLRWAGDDLGLGQGIGARAARQRDGYIVSLRQIRSEEHTPELQSRQYLV